MQSIRQTHAISLHATHLHSFVRQSAFAVGTATLEASSTAVLVGHEDWVHSVRFRPPHTGDHHTKASHSSVCTVPELLSCSMDRTMVLWKPEATSALWMAESSFGDAGACSMAVKHACHPALWF